MKKPAPAATRPRLLPALPLPTFARESAVVAAPAAREGLSQEAAWLARTPQETSERAARRVDTGCSGRPHSHGTRAWRPSP